MAKTVEVKILYQARRRSASGPRHTYLFHNRHLEFEFKVSLGRSSFYARHGFEQRAPDADPAFKEPSEASYYSCEEVDERVFEALKAMPVKAKGTVPLRLRIWRYRFFAEVLHALARPKDDGYNLGWPHPDDSGRILDAANQCKVTYPSGQREGQRSYVTFRDVPYHVLESSDGTGVLQMALIVEAESEFEVERTQEEVDGNKPAHKRILSLELGGADWSDLYGHGKKDMSGVESHQMGNVVRLAWNHTKPGEGHKVVRKAADQVLDKARKGEIKSLKDYALHCRNAADERLILANYIESNEETYQKPLSQVFKSAHSDMWWASPVNFIRTLSKSGGRNWLGTADLPSANLEGDDYLDLVAQIGAGHCGEHSYMTFGILKLCCDDMLKMQLGGESLVRKHDMESLRYMVRSGYYKEDNSSNAADHAFSIIGVKVTEDLSRKADYKTSSGSYKLWVLDIKKALAASKKPFFMVDAWVDGPVKNGDELLSRISSFSTTCVMLSDYTASETPVPAAAATTAATPR